MWPLILQKVKSLIESTKDHNIIVLEAAVLLSANWQNHCHEVWVSIIPSNEVKHVIYYDILETKLSFYRPPKDFKSVIISVKKNLLNELILSHQIANMLRMQMSYFVLHGAIIVLIFKLIEHGIVFQTEFLLQINF